MPDEGQLKFPEHSGEAAIIFSMRRSIVLIPLFLIACQLFSLASAWLPAQSSLAPTALQPAVPPALHTPESSPFPTPYQPAAPTTAAQSSPTGEYSLTTPAATAQEETFSVLFHPEGARYSGDQVSIEVIAPPDAGMKGRMVSVSTAGPAGVELGESQFEPYGLGGRIQAAFLWIWDTSGYPAGEQSLTFSVQPDGPVWMETITLLPRGQLPPAEAQAAWASAKSACCVVHYLTHSSAERDLPALLAMMDEQAEKVSQQMGMRLNEPVPVVLVPRLIGQGGFTGREIVLSYLDRNYVGADPAVLFHHELVHFTDNRSGGDLKPAMLVEGLAVYLSDGHYKQEPLLPRLAALLPPEPGCLPVAQALSVKAAQPGATKICGLDRYIPIEDLLSQFYLAQHEIGYLEAGSLVEFMVDTWGWTAFSGFYRDIHPLENPTAQPAGRDFSQARAVEAALQRHFGLTLAQLEARFLQTVNDAPVRPQDVEDVSLTIRFYDSVRRYQLILDPSAYFLNAWLPDTEQMRQHRIVADVLRNPTGPRNSALETMLITAHAYLKQGRYAQVQRLLDAIDLVLISVSPIGNQVFR